MITSISIPEEHQPYITRLVDEKGRSVIVNSSSRGDAERLSPSQLLAAGLAGCMSMTAKGMMFQAGLSYNDVTVTCDMVKEDEKYVFVYDLKIDSDEDPAAVEEIRKKASEGCYVRNILASGPETREK